jgi:hypothetical protein
MLRSSQLRNSILCFLHALLLCYCAALLRRGGADNYIRISGLVDYTLIDLYCNYSILHKDGGMTGYLA